MSIFEFRSISSGIRLRFSLKAKCQEPTTGFPTRPVPAFAFDFQLPTYKITQLPIFLYRHDPHRWKDQEI